MAQDSHSRSTDELIAEIARNRAELAAHRAGIRRAAKPADRLQRSFREHAGLFLGGAAVLGLLLSLIPSSARSREAKSRERAAKALEKAASRTASKGSGSSDQNSRSLAAIALGMAGKAAFEMGKPIVMRMLREHYLARHQGPSATPRDAGSDARARAESPTRAV